MDAVPPQRDSLKYSEAQIMNIKKTVIAGTQLTQAQKDEIIQRIDATSFIANLGTVTDLGTSEILTRGRSTINFFENFEGNYTASLVDVTGGYSDGRVSAGYSDNTFILKGSFSLQEPTGGDFYEGWLVRRDGGVSVISTGLIYYDNEIEDAWVNEYISGQDLLDHDFFVVTLEPNDGNPAPAKHILEGELTARDGEDY